MCTLSKSVDSNKNDDLEEHSCGWIQYRYCQCSPLLTSFPDHVFCFSSKNKMFYLLSNNLSVFISFKKKNKRLIKKRKEKKREDICSMVKFLESIIHYILPCDPLFLFLEFLMNNHLYYLL